VSAERKGNEKEVIGKGGGSREKGGRGRVTTEEIRKGRREREEFCAVVIFFSGKNPGNNSTTAGAFGLRPSDNVQRSEVLHFADDTHSISGGQLVELSQRFLENCMV